MSTVRDPDFWKRFSIAVHQDDAEKEQKAQQPELKHSYVIALSEVSSPSEPPSALMTPTDSPTLGSRGPGNPFAALGHAAGRILAGRFQAYKPLQPLSASGDGRMGEGLGADGRHFVDHG